MRSHRPVVSSSGWAPAPMPANNPASTIATQGNFAITLVSRYKCDMAGIRIEGSPQHSAPQRYRSQPVSSLLIYYALAWRFFTILPDHFAAATEEFIY